MALTPFILSERPPEEARPKLAGLWYRLAHALGASRLPDQPPATADTVDVPGQPQPSLPSEPVLLPDLPAELPVLAVLILDLEGATLEALLDAALAAGSRQPWLPVFLTTARNLAPFRQRHARFEFVPPNPPAGIDVADFELYRLARLEIWRRKWRFARIISAGPAARVQLECWRRSAQAAPDLSVLLRQQPPRL